MKVVDDLFLSLNDGNMSMIALLDFSLAFDTIDHSILVHCLHTDCGFTYAVLQWFSSYLTVRTQYLSLSDHCSTFAPVCILSLCLSLLILTITHHSSSDDLQFQFSAFDNISKLLHFMHS